jgi:hypothetical protein
LDDEESERFFASLRMTKKGTCNDKRRRAQNNKRILLNNRLSLTDLSSFSSETAKVGVKENTQNSHTLPIDKSEHS